MNTKRVGLVVDHPQRDLAGLVLTAYELCQRGVSCHLIPLNIAIRETFALAPDFILLNYLRRGLEGFARQLTEAGVPFGLLDTEGVVWQDFESYVELLWSDDELLAQTLCACMWGDKLAAHLLSRGLFTAQQMRVTGCPRFDFYHPMWRSVLLDRGAEQSGPQEPRILLNTNFSMVNPRFQSLEMNLKQYRVAFGWPEERLQEAVAAERCAIREMISLAHRIAHDCPAARLVIRVHPHESPEPYASATAGLANVEINASGPIQPLILSAVAVVQKNCTTAIEASMAGVPTLSPQWMPSYFRMDVAESVSHQCNTYAEMRSVLSGLIEGEYSSPLAVKTAIGGVVQDWFHRVDGLGYQRVADAVSERLHGSRSVNERVCRRFLYGLHKSDSPAPSRAGAYIRRALRLPVDWCFSQMRSVPSSAWWPLGEKFFGVSEVDRLVTRIQAARRTLGYEDKGVTVGLARDLGEYLRPMHGFSVTMSCG